MIVTRLAVLDDLETIHDIRRDAILGVRFAALSDRELREWADSRSVKDFRDRIAAGQAVIALIGAHPVGWGSASGNRVTALYVRSSASSMGIGRRLMSSLETLIGDEGHLSVQLESSPNAVAFYEGLGYLEAGVPDKDGAVPMAKDLRKAV